MDTETAYNLATNLPETAKGMFLQPGIRANQAIEAAKQGNYQEAAGRALQAIPLLGYAAEGGEKMAARGPKAKVKEIAGVGHAPTLLHDDQIGIVRDFLMS